MKFYQSFFYLKFISLIFLFSISKSESPRSILFEILSLPKGSTLNEKTFNKFVEELERKGIVDDELSDGFEFIGGPKGFYNYIESNAARLVIELGGELDFQKKQNAGILETVTLSKSPTQNKFLYVPFFSHIESLGIPWPRSSNMHASVGILECFKILCQAGVVDLNLIKIVC